ncbi:MAG: FAD-dependent thymidylate synthase [Candidatus Marsarchaeota archaeon]|nr:FAD-dependent thymidylate synthase [Candidatus Marsarchaeota archaeon]
MVENTTAPKVEKPMVRSNVPAANALIGVKFPVLDHGFIMLVDYMGDDNAIVQAARTSYGLGTRTTREDSGLIHYLMRHRHTTPFEMVAIKVFACMPMFVARQWIRHRTASVNEYSARYSVVPETYYVPESSEVQAQSKSNRQGRGGKLQKEVTDKFRANVRKISDEAYNDYSEALENGVTRELARIVLPVNYYTQWYWMANLHNIFHFLSLRMDSHAQHEIRAYTYPFANIVKAVAPVAYDAWEELVFKSANFSDRELTALKHLLRENMNPEEACEKAGMALRKEDGTPLKSGAGIEFIEKINRVSRQVDKKLELDG